MLLKFILLFFFLRFKVKEMELGSPEMKLGIEYGSHHRSRALATSWCFLQLYHVFYVVCLGFLATLLLNMSGFFLVDQAPVGPEVCFTQQKKFDTGWNSKLAIWTGKVAGCRWARLCCLNPRVGHTGAERALQSGCIMLSNNAKSLLSVPPDLRCAAPFIYIYGVEHYFNEPFVDGKSRSEGSCRKMGRNIPLFHTQKGLNSE